MIWPFKKPRKRRYEAASTAPRLSGWQVQGTSSLERTPAGDLRLLIARSRDSYKNDPHVKKAIDTLANYIIGEGVIPHIPAKASVAAGFMDRFIESCDALDEGRNLFYLQRQAVLSMLRDGEVLMVREWNRKPALGEIPFKIRLYPAEVLDHTRTKQSPRVEQGVEFSNSGKRVAYFLKLDPQKESVRFKASDVLHIFLEATPGQIRGVPHTASVLVLCKDLRSYIDANLQKNLQSSQIVGIFHGDTPGFPSQDLSEEIQKLQPGLWLSAPEGRSVTFAPTPQVEGTEIREYQRQLLHQISSGLDIPYHLLSQDVSEANYSALRAAMQSFTKSVEGFQSQLKRFLCAGLNRWLAEAAGLAGIKWTEPIWSWPKVPFVDPQNEAKAFQTLVESGFVSRQQIIRNLGGRPEEVDEELLNDPLNVEDYEYEE